MVDFGFYYFSSGFKVGYAFCSYFWASDFYTGTGFYFCFDSGDYYSGLVFSVAGSDYEDPVFFSSYLAKVVSMVSGLASVSEIYWGVYFSSSFFYLLAVDGSSLDFCSI